MSAPQVFGKMFAPTEHDYQVAVRKAILDLQQKHGITQTSIAQRIGVSFDTVNNAQEMRNSMKGWAVFRLLFEFMEEARDAVFPLLALCGPSAFPAADDGRIAIALREIGKIVEATGLGEVA